VRPCGKRTLGEAFFFAFQADGTYGNGEAWANLRVSAINT